MKYKSCNPEMIRDIRELVIRAAKLFGEKIAFRELRWDKEIAEYSFAQLEQDRNAFGTKLLQMGMEGYHVAVLSENMYAWVLSYLTVICGVGVVVPLDKELLCKDIALLLRKSDADAVICSETYFQEILDILDECPNIKCVIVMNPSRLNSSKEYPYLYDMQTLITQGRKLLLLGDITYKEKAIDAEHMCEVLFTSGTTGPNKGVMLSHKNLVADLYGFMHYIKVTPVSFSVLPLHHSFECTCHVLGIIYTGNTLCFNDSLKHLMENIARFKPGMSLMVPMFLEAMYKEIWQGAKNENLDKHLSYGIKVSNILRKFGIDKRRLFFKPILQKFGGNLEQIVCGGAPLRTDLIKKYDEIGINIINGYGITECTPVISTTHLYASDWKKLGTVGRVLPVCKVRIIDPDKKGNGEIQVNGDNVMLGYYKDDENTKKVFTADGYFLTGDLGHLDKNNFLSLSGRKKNLIILSNGKNVCPEELEEAISSIPYVKEVMVYSNSINSDKKEVIVADVFLDEHYLETNKIADIKSRLDQDVRKLNNTLPVYKRISNVKIMDQEFEKTTTKKIKRQNEMQRRIFDDQLCAQKNS